MKGKEVAKGSGLGCIPVPSACCREAADLLSLTLLLTDPSFDCRGSSTSVVTKCKALVRAKHCVGSQVLPLTVGPHSSDENLEAKAFCDSIQKSECKPH